MGKFVVMIYRSGRLVVPCVGLAHMSGAHLFLSLAHCESQINIRFCVHEYHLSPEVVVTVESGQGWQGLCSRSTSEIEHEYNLPSQIMPGEYIQTCVTARVIEAVGDH